MKVFGDYRSGNCYKIQLTADLLGIDYEWVDVDILKKENQSTDYLNMNPAGQIPIVMLDDGEILSESNAIINFLAADSWLLPKDPLLLAKVQQWQFFEQYSHEPCVAVARFIKHYLELPDDKRNAWEKAIEKGYKALTIMENALEGKNYLVNNQLSIADITLFAYTHVACEGGFDLSNYHAVCHWIGRVKSHPRFSPMKAQ